MSGILTAIQRAGGLTKLGRSLGIDNAKGVVYQWKIKNRVPPEYCPEVEKLTGVPSEELNDTVDWAYIRKQAVSSD
jgi:DNA-binding transcriptional regulator YdaS (Cro superfamily)